MFKWTKDLTQYKEYAHSVAGWMWEVLHSLACLDTWSPLVVLFWGDFFFFGTVTLLGEVSLWPWVLEVVSASESWLAAPSQ